jgi:hypothetical protein
MAGNTADIRILKIPLAFFGIYNETPDQQTLERLEIYIAKLKEELHRHALKSNETPNYFMPEDFKLALSVMPITLFRVGDEFEMPVDCAGILFEHAYLAYHAYRQKPDEQRVLLEILQSSPEYVYHLLSDDHERRERGEAPIPFQLSSGDILPIESLERMLLLHSPHWSILWLQKKFSDDFFRRILQGVVSLKEHDPGSAHCYHWLQTHDLPQEERTSRVVRHLETLGGSTWYAFLTALEHSTADCDPLLKSILESPAWCYEWLRWIGRGPRDLLVDKLLESAPWTVQYLVDVNPPDAGELFERARQKNTNPWWTEWIEFHARNRRG